MPPRSKRGCREPLCPGLTSERHGYCETHAHKASGWNAPHRGTAEQRGYDAAWRRLAREIRRRDGFRCHCAECVALGRVLPATETDHRIPKGEGGTDDPANLYAINAECHKRKTAGESKRARTVQ